MKKAKIIVTLLIAASIIALIALILAAFTIVPEMPAQLQPAPPQAQPVPTLPAYMQSSVAIDIAKDLAYFIVITGFIVAIIAFLVSKKIIRIRKEKAIFWDY